MITRAHLQKYIATNENLTIGKIGDVKSNELIDFWFGAYAFSKSEIVKEANAKEEISIEVKQYQPGGREPYFYINVHKGENGYIADGRISEASHKEKKEMIGTVNLFLDAMIKGIKKAESDLDNLQEEEI